MKKDQNLKSYTAAELKTKRAQSRTDFFTFPSSAWGDLGITHNLLILSGSPGLPLLPLPAFPLLRSTAQALL